ncbi:MAG TPA: hypothetical protein VMH28_30060 [Candidatus Acidoferrales bacterium]|nr:hypothetical protein [Candidatus Acidoferrales bacterium]
MKSANLTSALAAAPPAPANGRPRAAGKNGAGKRANGSRQDARPPAGPLCGRFAALDLAPVDAPMWPLYPAMWFQPELPPSSPQSSGLAIERRHPVPTPDFERCDAASIDLPAAPGRLGQVLVPRADAAVPASDLAPLGWDPRTVGRKERSQ